MNERGDQVLAKVARGHDQYQVQLAEIARAISDLAEMWPAFEVRMLSLAPATGPKDVLVPFHFHAQALADLPPIGAGLEPLLQEPGLLQGVLSNAEFAQLLGTWAKGAMADVGGWMTALPAIEHSLMINHSSNLRLAPQGLLRSVMVRGREFEPQGWMIWGTGERKDSFYDLQAAITSAFQIGLREFVEKYVGLRLGDPSYVAFNLTLPWMATLGCEVADGEVLATLAVRRRLHAQEYWIAAGPVATWAPSLPRMATEFSEWPDGWSTAQARFSPETSGPMTLWAGSSTDPEFSKSVHLTALPARSASAEVLLYLYEATNRSMAGQLAPGRGQRNRGSAESFEQAVGSCFGLTGMRIFPSGKAQATPGIDFLGFDDERAVCWVVSVTLGANVSRKLAGLMEQQDALEAQFPGRQFVGVLVTAMPVDKIEPSAVQDCAGLGVLLICLAQLQAFADALPDATDLYGALSLHLDALEQRNAHESQSDPIKAFRGTEL